MIRPDPKTKDQTMVGIPSIAANVQLINIMLINLLNSSMNLMGVSSKDCAVTTSQKNGRGWAEAYTGPA